MAFGKSRSSTYTDGLAGMTTAGLAGFTNFAITMMTTTATIAVITRVNGSIEVKKMWFAAVHQQQVNQHSFVPTSFQLR
jgi:hypothetical protein